MSRRKATPFAPQLTQLESREVPAVASTRLAGGALTVFCDNSPSSVLVHQSAAYVTVRDIVTFRGPVASYGESRRAVVLVGADWVYVIDKESATVTYFLPVTQPEYVGHPVEDLSGPLEVVVFPGKDGSKPFMGKDGKWVKGSPRPGYENWEGMLKSDDPILVTGTVQYNNRDEENVTAEGRQQTQHRPEERGFPRTVRPKQANDLPRAHLDVHVAADLFRAVAEAEPSCGEDGHVHDQPSRPRARSHRKNGAPMMAVRMPIGTSMRAIVRARVSTSRR